MSTDDSKLMGLREAGDVFGIHRDTAYKLAASGEFPVPVVRIGRAYKVSRRAVDEYLARLDGNDVPAAAS